MLSKVYSAAKEESHVELGKKSECLKKEAGGAYDVDAHKATYPRKKAYPRV
jgi:hypothetical protein